MVGSNSPVQSWSGDRYVFESGELVGFVNVAWDGDDHAFLLDTKTRGDLQRLGIATRLSRSLRCGIATRLSRSLRCTRKPLDANGCTLILRIAMVSNPFTLMLWL